MSIAVCPGSFDPITVGHLNIISRTAKLFDQVIVVVMINRKKPSGVFTPEERVDFIRRSTADIPNVTVDFYDGLLAEYVVEKGASAIEKRLRVLSDYYFGFMQSFTNYMLSENVVTICIVTDT